MVDIGIFKLDEVELGLDKYRDLENRYDREFVSIDIIILYEFYVRFDGFIYSYI